MMDALREGIHLRAYGQRDPLVEYQHEAYAMFQNLIANVKAESLAVLLRIRPATEAQPVSVFAKTPQQEVHEELSSRLADRFTAKIQPTTGEESEPPERALAPTPARPREPTGTPYQRVGSKVGRNDPCPCGKVDGVGKPIKYKKCCYPKYG